MTVEKVLATVDTLVMSWYYLPKLRLLRPVDEVVVRLLDELDERDDVPDTRLLDELDERVDVPDTRLVPVVLLRVELPLTLWRVPLKPEAWLVRSEG